MDSKFTEFFGLNGYRISPQKAQMARQVVVYLGYEITARLGTLGTERKEAICQTPELWTAKELLTFLWNDWVVSIMDL